MSWHRFVFHCFLLGYLTACASQVNNNSEAQNTAAIYVQLGERYLQLNKLAVAQENAERALILDTDNAQIYHLLALLSEKRRDKDSAYMNYEKALSLQPSDLRLQTNYGRFLCQQADMQKGIALLMQAANEALNDHPWLAMANLGHCYSQQGNTIEAEHYFTAALELNETYLPALFEMQKIRYAKGDMAGAKAYLVRYQQQLSNQLPLSQEANTFKSQ